MQVSAGIQGPTANTDRNESLATQVFVIGWSWCYSDVHFGTAKELSSTSWDKLRRQDRSDQQGGCMLQPAE